MEDDDFTVGDMWREHKISRQAKKAANEINSTKVLDLASVEYDSKNSGNHLIVKRLYGKPIDFWPSTGKFIDREDGKSGRGVRNLLKKL